jgi:predicted ATPase/serine/threonine protein kinase
VRCCPACRATYVADLSRCPIDGRPLLTTYKDPLLGQTVGGRYQINQILGAGGMGKVYRARHTNMERLFALKVLYGDFAADRAMAARFRREAQAMSVIDHPNVAAVVDFDTTPEGLSYLAMEFVDGATLSRAIGMEGPLPPERAASIARQIARGLAAAHARSVIHRDLKPQNVMLVDRSDERDVVKILDFGLARIRTPDSSQTADSIVTEAGGLFGTPAYMSPEQAAGLDVDARADLYSLGVILYTMLARENPFKGSVTELIHQHATATPRALAGIPPALVAVVDLLLKKNPADRLQTAAEVVTRIEALGLADWSSRPETRRLAPIAVRLGKPATVEPATALLESQEEIPATRASSSQEPDSPPQMLSPAPSLARNRTRTNLVPAATRFIGRRADLDALNTLLSDNAERLVTLLGPGGTGKTRLAREFGQTSLQRDLAGELSVWFCDLTEARSLDGVVGAVATAIGIPLTAGSNTFGAVRVLGGALAGSGRTLLILDNFEQVVEHGAATVGAWLAGAPELRVLVTSRELLRIDGEIAYEVPPLSLPENATGVLASEAVQLFVECARRVRVNRSMSPEEQSVVAEIVRRLDGMPLAIELAAARLKVFSVAQLREALARRFDILSGGSRQTSVRQATLRGAIDWSWNLLSPWEQLAFIQCSVFRGGFSLEAAAQVLDLAGQADNPSPADAVQALCEKSLLRVTEVAGEARFGMYESLRDYALEKLRASGLEAATVARHAAYFVAAGREWSEGTESHGGLERLRHLSQEMENLVAVHERAEKLGVTATQDLAAVVALEPVFVAHGPYGAFARLLDEALARTTGDGAAAPERVHALAARGNIYRHLGRASEALQDLKTALLQARKLGDTRREGRVLRMLGLVVWDEGRTEDSHRLYLEALRVHRAAGDRAAEGRTLGDLAGFEHEAGKFDRAADLYRECFAVLQEVGDRRSEGMFLGYFAFMLQEKGRREEARAHYDEALTILREVGDRRHEALFRAYRASLRHEMGALADGRRDYERAESMLASMGDQRTEGWVLAFRAALEASSDHVDVADHFFARSESQIVPLREPLLAALLRLLRGTLELARCRAGAADAAERRRVAEALVATVKIPAAAGGRALVEESMDARLALRLVERDLAR